MYFPDQNAPAVEGLCASRLPAGTAFILETNSAPCYPQQDTTIVKGILLGAAATLAVLSVSPKEADDALLAVAVLIGVLVAIAVIL
jgi:hypothetical protein